MIDLSGFIKFISLILVGEAIALTVLYRCMK